MIRGIVDLTSGREFWSKNTPGQWICWDFGEMRVRSTHSTIQTARLQACLVEGSLDGSSPKEVDLKTEKGKLYKSAIASYAVSKAAECRFNRLTRTGTDHNRYDYLVLIPTHRQ
jgi:hypothetical protein